MKVSISILILLISISVFGQNKNPKESFMQLKAEIRLGIWDKKNSEKSFHIDSIPYDEIPKYLDFRGTVVEALKWTDALGENILIQTVTGHFWWKDYDENSSGCLLQDKSELYAYLFTKKKGEKNYKKIWRVYDYNQCYGVDWYTGFIPQATSITDLDNDGIAEIAIPYVLICRGGMDPGTMKIIMYEGRTKYALRGSTMLLCKSEHPYGGESKPGKNLKKNKLFYEFLSKRWNAHKCEKGRYY